MTDLTNSPFLDFPEGVVDSLLESDRPVVFLDVDGVINHYPRPSLSVSRLKPLVDGGELHLRQAMGFKLWVHEETISLLKSVAEVADIVWLTAWGEDVFYPRGDSISDFVFDGTLFPVLDSHDGGFAISPGTVEWKWRRAGEARALIHPSRDVTWIEDFYFESLAPDPRGQYRNRVMKHRPRFLKRLPGVTLVDTVPDCYLRREHLEGTSLGALLERVSS